MTDPVTHKGWTLHYTIGDAIAAPVNVGDVVDTRARGELTILSGRSPHMVKVSGFVTVRQEDGVERETYVSEIGARWVSASGGLGDAT